MAQLVAHLLCKQGVRGSSPLGSTEIVPLNCGNAARGTNHYGAMRPSAACDEVLVKCHIAAAGSQLPGVLPFGLSVNGVAHLLARGFQQAPQMPPLLERAASSASW